MPYDTLILGYRTNTANTLRLWRAEAPESFDFAIFNSGDYYGAVNQKVTSENLSKVLYPNDEQLRGKELRLEQQYFFVSCSLQDMFRILRTQKLPVEQLPREIRRAAQRHPSGDRDRRAHAAADRRACARLGRGLEHHLPDLRLHQPHAAARGARALVAGGVRPRAAAPPGDHLRDQRALSSRRCACAFSATTSASAACRSSTRTGERYVRMAHLACVGSHAINGVAELHTELLKRDVLEDFYELWPQKFSNKTNGVTPRRWMVLSNPRLSSLITEHIGDGWIKDLARAERLEPLAEDAGFRARWREIKQDNKRSFAALAARAHRDRHRSRLHVRCAGQAHPRIQAPASEGAAHRLAVPRASSRIPSLAVEPRTFIFGGKAAPGYHLAKLMIKLITAVGDVVNRDPDVRDRLKVVFLPNFNVTNGQRVYPAADLSEQISTAGKEASGTGNMKFCMNGALTIGTLDGAEYRDARGSRRGQLLPVRVERAGGPHA